MLFVPGAFLLLFVMMDLFKIAVALEFSLTSESVQFAAIIIGHYVFIQSRLLHISTKKNNNNLLVWTLVPLSLNVFTVYTH